MSWDFWMEVDVGGDCREDLSYEASYTYNVSPMYYDAFTHPGGIRALDGLEGKYCQPRLRKAINKMRSNPEHYQEMNPENGWGNYDGAVALLEKLERWCKASPEAILRVV